MLATRIPIPARRRPALPPVSGTRRRAGQQGGARRRDTSQGGRGTTLTTLLGTLPVRSRPLGLSRDSKRWRGPLGCVVVAGAQGPGSRLSLERRGGGGRRGRGGGPRPAPSYKYSRSPEEAEEESFAPKDVDYSPSRRLDFHCWFLKGPQDPGAPWSSWWPAWRGAVASLQATSRTPPPLPFGLARPKSTKRDPKGCFDPSPPSPHQGTRRRILGGLPSS